MKRAIAIILTLALASPVAAQTTALRANDFLDTLGVATHLVQGKVTQAQIISGLEYTGIRNIRDDATHNTALSPTAFCAIHAQTGAMVDELPIVDADPNNIADTLKEYEGLAACGAMLVAEGPNEPNNFHFTYQGSTCDLVNSPAACAAYQRDEYAAIKADPNLAAYAVLSMTEVGAEGVNEGLQFLTVPSGTVMPVGTKYADYANLHNYIVGTNGVLQDNRAWTAEAPAAPEQCCFDGMDGEFTHQTWAKHFAANTSTLPRVTTETGWKTGNNMSQDQQGKLLTNLYLSAFKRGWNATFIYMLKDEGTATWGLYDSSYTPKLSATYIHYLTGVLADTNASFTPDSLTYSIPNEPATVHDLLLEKGNRTFELAVWNDQPTSENPNKPVTVNLPQGFSTVNVYDVTSGTTPIATYHNVTSVALNLTDHAQIIELPYVCSPQIINPKAGSTVSGLVTVNVSDTGCVGNNNRLEVSGAGFSNHYDFKGTSYSWDSTKAPSESLKMYVTAWDSKYLGQQGASPAINVSVNN